MTVRFKTSESQVIIRAVTSLVQITSLPLQYGINIRLISLCRSSGSELVREVNLVSVIFSDLSGFRNDAPISFPVK